LLLNDKATNEPTPRNMKKWKHKSV